MINTLAVGWTIGYLAGINLGLCITIFVILIYKYKIWSNK